MLHLLWSRKSLSTHEFTIAYWMLCLNFFGLIFSSTASIFRKAAIALGSAKKIYRNWIITRLFSALYAFISIYYFGIFGLATNLVLATILMSFVSFITAEKSGIKTRKMIYELLSAKRSILFLSIVLLSVIGLIFGFKLLVLSHTIVVSIVVKSILIGIIVFFLLMKLYKIEMNEILLSFKKK